MGCGERVDVQWQGDGFLGRGRREKSREIHVHMHFQHFVVISSPGCLMLFFAQAPALAVPLSSNATSAMQMGSADLLRPHLSILLDMNVVIRTLNADLIFRNLDTAASQSCCLP